MVENCRTRTVVHQSSIPKSWRGSPGRSTRHWYANLVGYPSNRKLSKHPPVSPDPERLPRVHFGIHEIHFNTDIIPILVQGRLLVLNGSIG